MGDFNLDFLLADLPHLEHATVLDMFGDLDVQGEGEHRACYITQGQVPVTLIHQRLAVSMRGYRDGEDNQARVPAVSTSCQLPAVREPVLLQYTPLHEDL